MKKMIIICFTLILAVTSGCNINDNQNSKTEAVKPIDMDPKDLPKVPAFQDKTTREYMASTKEVEPGYYLLESKLKGFKMLFPERGEIIPDLTMNKGEKQENIEFESYNPKTNVLSSAAVNYLYNTDFVEDHEIMLDTIRGKNGYKGSFTKTDKLKKQVYFAYKKIVFNDLDRKFNFTHSYFGYVKSTEEKNLGAEFSFMFNCQKDNKPCSLKEEDVRKKAKKMIYSITFNIKKESTDDLEYRYKKRFNKSDLAKAKQDFEKP
ncbi:lipoprotein YvcA [Bacillus sp. WMMC1349]|uniref:lipoprotein YvcA n=1 Tax=Bacillus sp. WMMC1349 TaxID=2736254 RepID=UPI0020A6D37C|nr:lipoprotein YvcA [Bacillus sp. WMMC1349]